MLVISYLYHPHYLSNTCNYYKLICIYIIQFSEGNFLKNRIHCCFFNNSIYWYEHFSKIVYFMF